MRPVVEAMEWETEFRPFLKQEWGQGQHMAIVAPTGQAKTTFAGGIVQDRKFVAAFDPKGGDSTLARLGWPRQTYWPPRREPWWAYWRPDPYEEMAQGKPFRRVIGPVIHTRADRARAIALCQKVLQEMFAEGGWTALIDEFQILSDLRMWGLGKDVEELLIAARDKGISVVTLFQAPRWVPHAASDQATWIAAGITRDRAVIERLAEVLGRPIEEVEGAIRGLGRNPKWSAQEGPKPWLVSHNNPRRPLIVTIPERISVAA